VGLPLVRLEHERQLGVVDRWRKSGGRTRMLRRTRSGMRDQRNCRERDARERACLRPVHVLSNVYASVARLPLTNAIDSAPTNPTKATALHTCGTDCIAASCEGDEARASAPERGAALRIDIEISPGMRVRRVVLEALDPRMDKHAFIA